MSEDLPEQVSRDEVLRMSVDIVASYVSQNQLPTRRIPEAISGVFETMNALIASSTTESTEALKPAVPIRRSVTPDFIICLEDGKKLKMLKRHLRTTYGLTPMEYRVKWGLPPDYPMVAPNYSRQRSEFAKKVGLGQKRKSKPKRA